MHKSRAKPAARNWHVRSHKQTDTAKKASIAFKWVRRNVSAGWVGAIHYERVERKKKMIPNVASVANGSSMPFIGHLRRRCIMVYFLSWSISFHYSVYPPPPPWIYCVLAMNRRKKVSAFWRSGLDVHVFDERNNPVPEYGYRSAFEYLARSLWISKHSSLYRAQSVLND